MEKYVYGGVIFTPRKFGNNIHLQTDFIEDKKTEFKGFGKLDRCLPYQSIELKHQIAAMLNTNGGKIFLGIANNGVVLGGDYSISDKQYLQNFLKNLTNEFKIAGCGLIDDPEYIEIPEMFVQPLINKPNSRRYLVVLNIFPSDYPVINSKGLLPVRDLGGVDQILLSTWKERKDREIYQEDNREKRKYINLKQNSVSKQEIKSRLSYAQALMTC